MPGFDVDCYCRSTRKCASVNFVLCTNSQYHLKFGAEAILTKIIQDLRTRYGVRRNIPLPNIPLPINLLHSVVPPYHAAVIYGCLPSSILNCSLFSEWKTVRRTESSSCDTIPDLQVLRLGIRNADNLIKLFNEGARGVPVVKRKWADACKVSTPQGATRSPDQREI